MSNVLASLARSLYPSREEKSTRPEPEMLGSGLANRAASKSLMEEYKTRLAIAQANDEEFPSFEEWAIQRR